MQKTPWDPGDMTALNHHRILYFSIYNFKMIAVRHTHQFRYSNNTLTLSQRRLILKQLLSTSYRSRAVLSLLIAVVKRKRKTPGVVRRLGTRASGVKGVGAETTHWGERTENQMKNPALPLTIACLCQGASHISSSVKMEITTPTSRSLWGLNGSNYGCYISSSDCHHLKLPFTTHSRRDLSVPPGFLICKNEDVRVSPGAEVRIQWVNSCKKT